MATGVRWGAGQGGEGIEEGVTARMPRVGVGWPQPSLLPNQPELCFYLFYVQYMVLLLSGQKCLVALVDKMIIMAMVWKKKSTRTQS